MSYSSVSEECCPRKSFCRPLKEWVATPSRPPYFSRDLQSKIPGDYYFTVMVGLTSRVAIDASEILRENHLTCLKKGMQKTTTDKKTLERPMMHGILKMTLYSSLGRFCLQSLRGIGELGGIFFLDLRWTFEKNTRS